MTNLRSLPCSTAAPLEDEDLLSEILLRLSPQPSSLPRASLVCKGWRSLVSDPRFMCRFRFRLRHRSSPLLGFFVEKDSSSVSFIPTMETPNRVPSVRFSLQLGGRFLILGCRHGLVLMLELDQKPTQLLVWDPFTGDHHRCALPLEFDKTVTTSGAVLRAAAGDIQHFQVVLVATHGDDPLHRRALAWVYSSETGEWGNPISTPLFTSNVWVSVVMPAVLYGNSLYWQLNGDSFGVLVFDLERRDLAVIYMPADLYAMAICGFAVTTRADGGAPCFLIVSDLCAGLWERVNHCDGIATWVLWRTIELDKLLPLSPGMEDAVIFILGFAEQNNAVVLRTSVGVFMVHLESLDFKKIPEPVFCTYHPFERVYAAGNNMSLHI